MLAAMLLTAPSMLAWLVSAGLSRLLSLVCVCSLLRSLYLFRNRLCSHALSLFLS